MKRKLLVASLLSLCSLTFFVSESHAIFGLLHPHNPYSLWNRHHRYVTHITVRPYNAFTPICWGNLVCDGVCPSPCGVANGCLPMQFGVPPFASNMMGFGAPCCGDACHASDMPIVSGPPMHSMPPINNAPPQQFSPMPQQYQGPMPTPAPGGGPNVRAATPMMPTGVSQANYYPMPYYPNYYMPGYYNPYMGWPQSQPMPYYWYNYGR